MLQNDPLLLKQQTQEVSHFGAELEFVLIESLSLNSVKYNDPHWLPAFFHKERDIKNFRHVLSFNDAFEICGPAIVMRILDQKHTPIFHCRFQIRMNLEQRLLGEIGLVL